jgi:uncharacterized protein (DUF1800 family)
MTTVQAFIAASRFGFGARPGELKMIASDPRGWLLTQLHDSPLPPPQLMELRSGVRRYTDYLEVQSQDSSAQLEFNRIVSGTWLPADLNARTLAAINTNEPFRERLVHFWANHFAVSTAKGTLVQMTALPYETEAIRANLMGKFEKMVLATAQHPAMLVYLDNYLSYGPNSTAGRQLRRGLNENYARELLELHTLGVNGGYTQNDVTEAAKVLTGWSLMTRQSAGIPIPNPAPQPPPQGAPATVPIYGVRPAPASAFLFQSTWAEPNAKFVLGKVYGPNGVQAGIDLITDLARHPSTARHIATKLARHFIADEPPTSAVDKLAKTFRDTGGDLREMAIALVNLPEAWETPLTKVKTPNDLVISTKRLLQLDLTGATATNDLRTLGQLPWTVTSPAGWPDKGADWLGPSQMNLRLDWAANQGTRAPRTSNASNIAIEGYGPVISADSAFFIRNAASVADGVGLVVAAPEFQRR